MYRLFVKNEIKIDLYRLNVLWCNIILCFLSLQSGVELELVECQPLLEWLANNYKSFGATLEIITDKSQEGSQFVRGFGGIGGKSVLHLLSLFMISFQADTTFFFH